MPSAGFLIIFCCVFCTYIYVYDYLWFLLFSVCFYLIFFVCLTKFMFFCFSCLLATLQVVVFLLSVACLMIVYCVFLCLHLYKDKSLFDIFGCGLFVCFLFFFVLILFIGIFNVCFLAGFLANTSCRCTQFFTLSFRFFVVLWLALILLLAVLLVPFFYFFS